MYLVTLSTVPVWQLADYLCVSVINWAGIESIVAALVTIKLLFDSRLTDCFLEADPWWRPLFLYSRNKAEWDVFPIFVGVFCAGAEWFPPLKDHHADDPCTNVAPPSRGADLRSVCRLLSASSSCRLLVSDRCCCCSAPDGGFRGKIKSGHADKQQQRPRKHQVSQTSPVWRLVCVHVCAVSRV